MLHGKPNKLLAQMIETDEISVIESVFSNVAGCGFSRVLVVVAPDQPEIGTMVQSARFSQVINPQAASGMGSSISVGMKQILQEETETLSGVAIYLGDMPSISKETSRSLLEEFKCSGCGQIVRPAFSTNTQTTPGHPVIFPTKFFPALVNLFGEAGAKHLIAANQEKLIEVSVTDAGVIRDIDHPADLSP